MSKKVGFMYKNIFTLVAIIVLTACGDSSTSSDNSLGGDESRPPKQSSENICVVESIENGFRQVVNDPDYVSSVSVVTRYSDALVLLDYDFYFYGKATYDFSKLCAKAERDIDKYVDGTFYCKNYHLKYQMLEDYREPTEFEEYDTMEEFHIEMQPDCQAYFEDWYGTVPEDYD